MADEEDPSASAPAAFADTLYPPPPSVYTRFTRKNLDLVRELLEAEGIQPASYNDSAASDIENSLEWLTIEPQARIERQNRILGEIKSKRKGQDANTDTAPGEPEVEDGKDELPSDLDFDLQLDLLPPRLDWIEEEGAYFCFNERWPVRAFTLRFYLKLTVLLSTDPREASASFQLSGSCTALPRWTHR